MPYVTPSPPSPEATLLDLPPLKLRPKHRRTRSATPTFSNEPGQGAFVPMTGLPRRRPGDRKAQFHFDDQDSDSSDETVSVPSNNSLGLTVDTKNVPSNVSLQLPHEQLKQSTLPFPSRGSPLPSPRAPSPPQSASSLPRTPSTPIILSNGKPLKPSLKSSHSSPHIPGLHVHARAQSEPCTPSGTPIVKNVHFAEKEALQSVRLFNSSGKPASVSKTGPAADETETETEYDSSNPNGERKGYPFPSVVQHLTFEVDHAMSSPIPPPNPPDYANVHLETLNLPTIRPPMLCGSVLVRNVAFAKEVAVRFTLDDWQTTSEVACRHVVSLPSLPPPFNAPTTYGDHAASSLTANTWDRFNFTIRLEDFERKLSEKTIYLVVRYTSPGVGEWWDNNSTKNYRVCFKTLPGHKDGASTGVASDTARFSPVMGNSQQRTFSAPPTLKGTPTTEAVQAVANAQPPSTSRVSPSFAIGGGRRHASTPARPSPPPRSNSSPQVSALGNNSFASSSSYMRASLPTKLNLLNYAAPSPSRSPSSASTSTSNSPSTMTREVSGSSMGMIGGMPATSAPQYDFDWSRSNNSSSQSLASPPSPPPSYSAFSASLSTPSPTEAEKDRAKSIASSPTSTFAPDSSYAAFVKQWCFAQSPSPSPGLHMSTEGRDVGVNGIGPAHLRQRDWHGMESFNGGLYGPRSDSPMLAG